MAENMDKEELKASRPFKNKEFKGVFMHDSTEVDDFPGLNCRNDDVWVCSFPRSGTTLTQQITYLVMTLDFEKGRTVVLDDRFPYADIVDHGFPYYRGLKYIDNLPKDVPRLIKTHVHYFLLPEELKNGKGKIIYITRNPKSSAISLYKLQQYLNNKPGPFRDFIEDFIAGKEVLACPWGLHIKRFWEHRNDNHILFLQFEKLIEDRRGAIQTIADFLGRDLTKDQIERILEETTLENMKSNSSCNWHYFDDLWQTNKTEGAFINTGKKSGWKQELPEDLIKQMDEMIQNYMKKKSNLTKYSRRSHSSKQANRVNGDYLGKRQRQKTPKKASYSYTSPFKSPLYHPISASPFMKRFKSSRTLFSNQSSLTDCSKTTNGELWLDIEDNSTEDTLLNVKITRF